MLQTRAASTNQDPKNCCPETCCFNDLPTARQCLGDNVTEKHQEWCGYFPTADSAANCWLNVVENATGHLFCTPLHLPSSSATRAGRFTWLVSLLMVACWVAIAAAEREPVVKRDLSLGIYKGKDNFMYYNDGVRVNWTELSSSHAKGYQDIRNGVSSAGHFTGVKHTLQKRKDEIYTLKGDGDPHQNYKFVQVSPKMTCADHDCSVAQGYSVTTDWTANVGGAWFASLGFSVTESHTDGVTFSCNGANHESMCVWHQTDLTAYTATVQEEYCGGMFGGLGCPVSRPLRDIILFSPNNRQCGLDWHCREGSDCTYKDAEYYIKCGPPGAEDCDHRENVDGWGGDQYYQLPAGC
ncbi:hypothetical protein PHSY_001952 [Pseudozyma hubeiensis SY62]|uniref:Uncharacterized protein n=1 Tax=Pseudozyma hubeiensis (strain SY62) TaxID=1305764 RepID=R9NZX1_PSEHS|nr:hypothetical protein PHSY_001952 [Pseudozyma hubeiensis SY62]GAC94381.1 hypothetical protein PHSY_001952 [Pseudozyma hubeiensis SY62]